VSKKKRAKRTQLSVPALPLVTFRNVEVDFEARTVSVNGRKIGPVEARCIVFPILSGDAIFMAKDMERVG